MQQDLLRNHANGEGTKPILSVRLPEPYKQALEQLAQKRETSAARVLLAAGLAGDPELRQLTKQYSKAASSTRS
ncbi:MAG TPA: hypothetical protein VFH39_03410 [Candidatus Saccharimonadales bacterium]|nr:hypothetical protein [Candidatus Saccharimonadales bacterium]